MLQTIQTFPLLLAGFLSIHGFRKKSLSLSGALTALLVGFLVLSGGLRTFGVGMIGLYLIGSRATKYGKVHKTKLEEGYHEEGNRTGWQVLCNSAGALVAAFAWNMIFVPESIHAQLAMLFGLRGANGDLIFGAPIYSGNQWCPLDVTIADGWSKALVFVALGQFACCLGDTLASELGILSGSRPRLITTFKPVAPGTNGAISIGGTVASLIGGLLIGTLMGVTLIIENRTCSVNTLAQTVWWGTFGGGVGSLIDSFLGATVQRTRYSLDRKQILQDSTTDKHVLVNGLNILSNNQVNMVSSVVCAGLLGWLVVR